MIRAIASATIFIPVIMGLLYWKKLDILQKYFYWFIWISVLTEGLAYYTYHKEMNNHVIFELFLILDLVFFFWFFNKYSKFPKWLKLISTVMVIFIPILEISIRLIVHKTPIESLFYIVIFFYFVIQSGQVLINLFDKSDLNPLKNYIFWIASARLIYYLFILFIFAYPELIKYDYKNSFFNTAFIVINTTGNIICNIMYGISFYDRRG